VSQDNDQERKPADDDKNVFERSVESFQENIRKSAPLAAASYTLIGAILLFGLVGYGIDRWRSTSPFFLIGGLLLGIIVGFYNLAKVVWRR
jgi:F0F1-type ATP synthase assembly protein I